MSTHYDFPTWIPACPEPHDGDGASRTSASVAYGLLSVCALVVAVAISARFNSVVLFTHRVRTQGISNTLWLVFFAATCANYASRALYMALGPRSWIFAEAAGIAAAVFQGIAVLTCALALNHQRCHRSDAQQPQQSQSPQAQLPDASAAAAPLNSGDPLAAHQTVNSDPGETGRLLLPHEAASASSLATPGSSLRSRRGVGCCGRFARALVPTFAEALLLALFVLHYAVLFLQETYMHAYDWFVWVYVGSSALQGLPIPLLVLAIVLHRGPGPRPSAKAMLGVACVVHVLLLEPLFTWGVLLPQKCLWNGGFLSAFDLLLLGFLLPIFLYFAFLVKEFARQKEECMYQFIRQSESGMAYRPF